jgi:hypothetical protein
MDLGGRTVAAGRLIGVTADHIEISDSEIIDVQVLLSPPQRDQLDIRCAD